VIVCEAHALLESQAVIVPCPIAVAGIVMTLIKLPSEAAVVWYVCLVSPWTKVIVTALPDPK